MGDETPDDVLEQGGGRRWRLPGWRPSRGAEVLAVAALVAGLAAGYTAGHSGAGGGAAGPRPAVTVTASASGALSGSPAASFSFAGSPALIQDPGECAVQTGHELQLGIQVTNQATQPVTLMTARAVLPLGGLTLVTWQWGTCGALADGLSQGDELLMLMPGESTWLAATFKVELTCPGPLPVQFSVGYQVQGHSVTASLPGFSDLGQVPYNSCPTSTSDSFSAVPITATP